jgi:hypothetical protein
MKAVQIDYSHTHTNNSSLLISLIAFIFELA